MPEQVEQPHGGRINRGGNEGNAYGAGRHRSSFRTKAARAADEGLDFWIAVAKGNKVVPIPAAMPGQKDDTRRPTLKERKEAYAEILLRFGIGTQDEILMVSDERVFEAIGAILPEFVSAEQIAPFLTRLKSVLGDQS